MKLTRKYQYRRNLPHYEKSDRAHFLTFITAGRWELPPRTRDLVLAHCIHDHARKLYVYICVVMPDHVHLVFQPLRNSNGETFTFAEITQPIKGASAHSVNKLLLRHGSVWQDESFDHVVRNDERLDEVLDYVRMNPVRKGLVNDAKDYPWLWEPEFPLV